MKLSIIFHGCFFMQNTFLLLLALPLAVVPCLAARVVGLHPTMGASFHEVGSQIFRESNPQGVKVVLLNFLSFCQFEFDTNLESMLTYHYYNENLKTLELETSQLQSLGNHGTSRERCRKWVCTPKYITLNLIFHIFDKNSKLGHLWMEKRG